MPVDKNFLLSLKPRLPLSLRDLELPNGLTVLVLAPHPDDFDAIGVTMRLFQQRGHEIHVAVLTTGASGVDDGWNGANDVEAKAALREAEQEKSCMFFGLPQGHLRFLRMWEQADDADLVACDNARLCDHILAIRPDLVFLPHGNDSNRTHRRTFETFDAIAQEQKIDALAFLNQDAKTLGMRSDVYMPFDQAEATWKAELLRLHSSQHERNLKSRGYGFDERVLAVNRQAAVSAGYIDGYAELFELKGYGKLAEIDLGVPG